MNIIKIKEILKEIDWIFFISFFMFMTFSIMVGKISGSIEGCYFIANDMEFERLLSSFMLTIPMMVFAWFIIKKGIMKRAYKEEGEK